MKAFKIQLKLNPESSPHLYVRQINDLIKNDNYLHPMLKGLLLTLKKARMPYARLSLEKEIVIVPVKHLHYERATSPDIHAWGKIEWTEEEKAEFDEDPKKYIKAILKLQESIGYDIYKNEDVLEEEVEEIEELTKKKTKKKWWAGKK